jgi:hypothetical protein
MSRRFHSAVLMLCLSLAVIALKCGKSPSQVVTTGGSEVVGKLVTAANSPVANARVFAYKIPADASTFNLLQSTSPIDTAISNDLGEYKFTKLDVGYFHLFASGKYLSDSLFASHDKVYNDYIAPASESTHKINVGVDTMKAPGSISGNVVLEPGYPSAIQCYIPGSSYISITDNTGSFFISNIPAGTYSLIYSNNSGGEYAYATVEDSNIVIVSDSTTRLPPKTMQLATQNGPPAPVNIHAVYDTVNGKVTVSWNKVNVSDLKEFVVFRKEATQDSFTQIGKAIQPETSFVDIVYKDSLDSSAHVYLYEIYSRDQGDEMGSHSDFCSVSVVSPALVRTLLLLQAAGGRSIDTVAVFNQELIFCDYANRLVGVDSLIWSLEKPDSIIRRSWAGSKNGSDTLRISWDQPGTKKVYCRAVEERGKWVDSITVVVIKDTPVIKYLSPDTTVEFGGMVRCSIDVAHQFGSCTLYVDLNRDSVFEIKRIGLSFDTVFSTNTDAIGGRVRIKITDSHHNVVNTFFTLTIAAPQHEHWEECVPMPTPRKFLSVCVNGKTLYAIGGCKRTYSGEGYSQKAVNTLEAYDSIWTAKDSMKTARYSFACGEYNGSIYVFGGRGISGFLKSIERYEIATNKWSSVGNMPFALANAASCVYNNKLYLFGGRKYYQQNNNDSVGNDIHVYDFSNNQWSNLNSHMNMSRHDFQAVVIRDKIYLIGGLGGSLYSIDDAALTDVEIFDPQSNQCSSGPQMYSSRSYFAAVSIGDSIFTIGGNTGSVDNPALVKSLSVFDPLKSVWTEKNFPAPHSDGRSGCGAGVVNGKIVIVGGGTDLSKENSGFTDGVVRKYYP